MRYNMKMLNKKYIFFILLIIGLISISSVSANDFNMSEGNLNYYADDVGASQVDTAYDSIGISEDDILNVSKTIYFDASASSNGDGSESNPYKYVNQNTLNSYLASGDEITAYFAEGTYTLNTPFYIFSNVVFIGESSDSTIFNSVLANKYDFEIMEDASLELNDITFNKVNILNHGTLEAYNSDFENSVSFSGNNAPLIYDANEHYNSSYGGVINCNPSGDSSPYVYLEYCTFSNNNAYCGGVIALNNSRVDIYRSEFYNSKASRQGGVIYAVNSSIAYAYGSYFDGNSAGYGGIVYGDSSLIAFNKTSITNSKSDSFGGIVGSKFSRIIIDLCDFANFSSVSDAGGALYVFCGMLYSARSNYTNGSAMFGGAITSLMSDIELRSNEFSYNTAYYGGVIYNLYGKMFLKGNIIEHTYSVATSDIMSDLSDDLYFSYNMFVNSTSKIVLHANPYDPVEGELSQNFFENRYSMYVEFTGYLNGEKIVVKSNVLDYVKYNFLYPIYFTDYYNPNSAGDYNKYVRLNIYDVNHPYESTIFGQYDEGAAQIKIDLETYGDFYNCSLKYKGFTNGVLMEDYLMTSDSDFDVTLEVDFNRHIFRLNTDKSNIYYVGGNSYSSINSSYSTAEDIPSSYDSRDYGFITPVKNQKDGGNCWAFSSIATLEACIKKITGITYDLSEENMKNRMAAFSTIGLNANPNSGGIDPMVMGYLTSWFGPTGEILDPYDDLSSLSLPLSSDFRIQNILFLPSRDGGLNDDVYKKAIMDYGAISVTFRWLNAGLHSVSIVGWDDNYKGYDSLNHYAKGAWIFKNSWGSEWGNDGYGYLSYDTLFESDTNPSWYAYTFVFNENDHYFVPIHYDFSGPTNYIESNGPIYGAVKFNNNIGDVYLCDRVSAFSTYFKVPTYYTVELVNLSNDETLLYQEGYSEAGYYTIPFNEEIHINSDDGSFSDDEYVLIVGYCNDGLNYLPVCQAEKLTMPLFQKGVTFVSFGADEGFEDLYDLEDSHYFLFEGSKSDTCQAAAIHVFLNSPNTPFLIGMDVSKADSVAVGENAHIDITFNNDASLFADAFDAVGYMEGTLVHLSGPDGKDFYEKIYDGKASFDLIFHKVGKYEFTVQYGTDEYAANDVSFVINVVPNIVVSADDVSKVFGGDESFVATVTDNSGKPIANEPVNVNIGGVDYSGTTDSNGRVSVPIDLNVGTYNATVTYQEFSATAKVTVNKLNTKTTLSYVNNAYDSVTLTASVSPSSTGKVVFTVNGEDYPAVKLSGSKATYTLNNLAVGSYAVKATYKGDANHKASVSNSIKFTVDKDYVNIAAPDVTMNYGGSEKLVITLTNQDSEAVGGAELRISLGDKNFTKTTNSKGKLSLDIDLDSGSYDAVIVFDGNDKYKKATASAKVTVNKLNTKTTLSYVNNAYDSVTLTAAVSPSAAKGKVTFNVNGKDRTVNIKNSKATLTLDNLAAKSYTVKATYNGDTNYKSSSDSISFNIRDDKLYVSAPDLTKYYHGPERFVVTVKENDVPIVGKNVTINLNGKPYIRVTDDNGQASMAINLNSGTYEVTSEFEDIKVNSTITIKSTVSGKDVTKIFRNATQYYATFVDTKGNLMKNTDIKFNINGVFYTRTTDDKGVARMNINLPPGTYIITAENPNSTERYTNVIKVLSSIVENHDLTKYYRNASKYTLRVLGDDGNPVGEGVTVKLNINGVFYERKTDASGYMSMNINLPPGTYTVTAEYNGLRASNTIRVLSILKTGDLSMKYRDGSKFEAKILDGQGKPYAGQTVSFNINGVFYQRTSGDDGVARLSINLMAGEYIITSMFNGLNAANKVTISG